MNRLLLYTVIITTTLLTACNDNTDGIGATLTDVSDNMEFDTNEISITSETTKGDANNISARSSYAYLGQMYDDETDSDIKADFMTQITPLTNQYLTSYIRTQMFAGIDSILVYDDDNTMLPIGTNLTEEEKQKKLQYMKADSCMLTFYVSSHKGDSLAQMTLNVRELSEPYVEGTDYPISFNPETEGMVRNETGAINENRTYSIKNMVAEGRKKSSTSSHYISIPLNKEYKGRDGVTYSNYGTYIMKQYLDENAAFHKGFNNQSAFLKTVCPGFYMKHVGGEGAMASITATALTIYYRVRYPSSTTPGSDHTFSAVLSGTEESLQHSTLSETSTVDLVADSNDPSSNYTWVKSPHAIYTQLTIDAEKIMADHEKDSLSTVRIFVQNINKVNNDEYTFKMPQTLLLLPKDSLKTFFEKKQVSNNKTSYLATYSSSVNGYTFSNISTLVTAMYRNHKEGNASADWNKVLLVPVETNYSTINNTSLLTKVSHSMALESTKLRKGTLGEDSPIKATIIYTRYKE